MLTEFHIGIDDTDSEKADAPPIQQLFFFRIIQSRVQAFRLSMARKAES